MKPSKKSTSVFRPGEPKTAESSRSLLVARFFDPRRYDLAAVGRYKVNKKLNIKTRLLGQTIAENLVDPETGEILVEAGTEMTRDVIDSIAEYLDGDLNKFVYTPNDYAVVTEPVVLLCGNRRFFAEKRRDQQGDLPAFPSAGGRSRIRHSD